MTRLTLLLALLYGLAAFGGATSPLQGVFGTARGDAGCNADPDGRCIDLAPTTDEGCEPDPNGKPLCRPGQ